MQIIKKCDHVSPYVFLAAVIIHLAVMCGEYGVWEVPYRGRLLQVAFVLCCIKILMTYYSYAEWLMLTGMGIISVVSYLCTKEKYVVYVVVLIFAAKSVETKMILKVVLYASILATIIVAVLALLGKGGMVVDTRDYGRGTVESRFCLGFSHANNLHGTFWYIVSLIVILYQEKMGWISYTVMAVLNVIMFVLTGSKTGFGVTMIVLIAGILYRYAGRYTFEKMYPYILGYIALAGVEILTVASMKIDCFADYGPVMKKLDSITTGRLNLNYQSAYIGDMRLFSAGGTHRYALDDGFATLPSTYGIVIALVYLAFTVGLIYITSKNKNGILFSVVMTCVVYTFMESSFTLNDAYLLANISFVVAIYLFGEKKPPVAEE